MSPSGTKSRLAARGGVPKCACSLALTQTPGMHGIYLRPLHITSVGLREKETNTNMKLTRLAVL